MTKNTEVAKSINEATINWFTVRWSINSKTATN